MKEGDALRAGRESFARRAWADTFRLLEAADRESPLDPEDLERLATAAYLLGKDVEVPMKSSTERSASCTSFAKS
jgi:hypothetical protein